MTLHVNSFGGGVVLAGAPDQRNVDEVLAAESFDLGPRGALVCTSDVSNYLTLEDDADLPFSRMFGLLSVAGVNFAKVLGVGEGDGAGSHRYIWDIFDRDDSVSPIAYGGLFGSPLGAITPTAQGVLVTGTSFPGFFQVKFPAGSVQTISIYLLCLGAREGFAPNTAPGIYVFATVPPSTTPTVNQIMRWDALGTGDSGSLPVGGGAAGTKGKQLYFRGIIAYNGHVFGWGFDSHDTTNKDGPNRVMFCNLANPLKWGNDDIAASGDRDFTDSDAIILGDAGERIRGAIKWNGKLWFGTNQQLHYIAGFGRDSFLTDGANPVAKSYNIVGPNAMIEGPDRKLYGVCDQGLWVTADGVVFTPLFQKLYNFAGFSPGWFDCIWTDSTRTLASYPGRTNQDLVWMEVDWDRQQVVIGIPWCNASTGSGYGADTVVIKYHVQTGGFTRQLFPGVQYTAAGYFRREGQQPAVQCFGTATSGQSTVKRYGYKRSNSATPKMPTVLPHATLGWYAPYGPDGDGTVTKVYLTVSWYEANLSAGLPLSFQITVTVDQRTVDRFKLYIKATTTFTAQEGDYWLDVSQSSNWIGNNTAATGIPAARGYLLKVRKGGKWEHVDGQGEHGNRATIGMPIKRQVGGRYTVDVQTITAAGRFEIEGLGLQPGAGATSGNG